MFPTVQDIKDYKAMEVGTVILDGTGMVAAIKLAKDRWTITGEKYTTNTAMTIGHADSWTVIKEGQHHG